MNSMMSFKALNDAKVAQVYNNHTNNEMNILILTIPHKLPGGRIHLQPKGIPDAYEGE